MSIRLAALGPSGALKRREESSPVRARLRVDALVRQPEPLHRLAANQVLVHNRFGVFRLHMAIPDRLGIHHNRGTMLALIKAKRLVDAHLGRSDPCGLRRLLHAVEELAGAGLGAGRAWRTRRAYIVTDEDVTFKKGQSDFLLVPA